MSLRALTAATGGVHEAQRLQLQSWGGVVFGTGKGAWTCDADPSTRTVTYDVASRPAHLASWRQAARFVAALDRSVHWLFGPEWGLVVRERGTEIYAGARQRRDVNRERRRRARS